MILLERAPAAQPHKAQAKMATSTTDTIDAPMVRPSQPPTRAKKKVVVSYEKIKINEWHADSVHRNTSVPSLYRVVVEYSNDG